MNKTPVGDGELGVVEIPQSLYVMEISVVRQPKKLGEEDQKNGSSLPCEMGISAPKMVHSVILLILLAHNNQAPAPWPNKSCVGLEIVQIDIGDRWNSLRYQQTNHVMVQEIVTKQQEHLCDRSRNTKPRINNPPSLRMARGPILIITKGNLQVIVRVYWFGVDTRRHDF